MAHEPAWAKGLREATSSFLAARGQRVDEDLAYRQDARAERAAGLADRADARAGQANQRANAVTQAALKGHQIERARAQQEIELASQEERRRSQDEALELQERKDVAAIRSGSLETLIGEADDPQLEQQLQALQSVLPNLSPKAGAILMEEARNDFQRAGVRKSVDRVRAELMRATQAGQGEQPLMDEKTARATFAAVESYAQTGEGLSPDDVLGGIAKMRTKRAEATYERAMTGRMFEKLKVLMTQPGFSEIGTEKAAKIMAMAREFPPENEEQRAKLWSNAVGALLETEQRTVKVLGNSFEDVSGWSKGGRIPNPRQLQEMRLIAASLLTQRRHPGYVDNDETGRARMEDSLAKSIAIKYGWEAWPKYQGQGHEAISGPYAGMQPEHGGASPVNGQAQLPAGEPDPLKVVADTLASGGDAKAVRKAMVDAGMDPDKITPEQKKRIRALAEEVIGKRPTIAPKKPETDAPKK